VEQVSGDGAQAALERVAPGTGLRQAIDHVIAGGSGALIVIGDEPGVARISNGGFVIDTPFTPQRLFELAKMDGAIILDDAVKTIMKANVHLVLDPSLHTAETGMRNRTAERVGRQTKALAIAVSRRSRRVALYTAGTKMVLEDLDVILAKANQALQTLQRFRARLDEASARLTALEFDDAVSVGDVIGVLQAQLALLAVARAVQRHVLELGSEGGLVSLQADELTADVVEDHAMLLRDYAVRPDAKSVSAVRSMLAQMTREQVKDDAALAGALGFPSSADVLEYRAQSRGYRLMRRIPLLPPTIAGRLVERFGSLAALLQASEAQLEDVEGVGARRARALREGMYHLRHHR
jgi:diadenylate cyclase